MGWITSQNDTAPKLRPAWYAISTGWITSQNDTAPKLLRCLLAVDTSWITSQNDTAPKRCGEFHRAGSVGLPVRTTLLQNGNLSHSQVHELDYQSERHCSKTEKYCPGVWQVLDYQSERHCSKTKFAKTNVIVGWITSQNDTAPKLKCSP